MSAISEMVAELQAAEAALSEANRKAKEAKQTKKRLTRELFEAVRRAGLEGVRAHGQTITTYELPFAHIIDRAAFAEWARLQDEEYFDPEPKVRGDLLNGLVRQRLDDGEDLPPGLSVWVDERISRNKVG